MADRGRLPIWVAAAAPNWIQIWTLVRNLAWTTVWALFVTPVLADVSPARRAELLHLLAHDCGSCHGMRLTGGLGPPLTSAALVDKPNTVLEHVIEHGRPGTPMPPWGAFLSEEETRWLVKQLKTGETQLR